VEVDGAAPLVVGDLGEVDAGVLSERTLAQSRALGDLTAQVDGEAPPQGPGVCVPEDGGFVVVRIQVERCAEFGCVCGVLPQRQRPESGRLWTGPKPGAVKVAKTRG
jgi:hypothetical protein